MSDVEVDARHALTAYLLDLPRTAEERRQALHASLGLLDAAADAVTIPLYAALWRAVLGSADFSLHLVGPTGAGKSELAALAQQHYGAGMTARHLPAAWTSTENALEGLAFEAKDVLLVVDDFCPRGRLVVNAAMLSTYRHPSYFQKVPLLPLLPQIVSTPSKIKATHCVTFPPGTPKTYTLRMQKLPTPPAYLPVIRRP